MDHADKTIYFKKKKKSAIITTPVAESSSKGVSKQTINTAQGSALTAPKNEKKAAKRARAMEKKDFNDELDQALAELSVQ